jgi:hypothetical protein
MKLRNAIEIPRMRINNQSITYGRIFSETYLLISVDREGTTVSSKITLHRRTIYYSHGKIVKGVYTRVGNGE